MEKANIPINYRDYQGPVSGMMLLNPRGWLYNTAGNNFPSPEGTHHMLYDYDELPPFMGVRTQASERVDKFFEESFRPIAGIMALGSMTVRQALSLHEKGTLLLEQGALVVPYFMDNQLINGIKIYQKF